MRTQFLKSIMIAVLMFLVVPVGAAPTCRDCPFPMKIGDNVWIMPNEKIEVTIDRYELPSRFEEIHVVLRDPVTREILASGTSKQKAGRKTVNVQLFDIQGNQIKGFVRYVDLKRQQIQAKFSCDDCEIGKMLDQTR